jgi:multiple sugar transport system permease protein
MNNRRAGSRLGDIASYIFMLVAFAFFAGPLLWLLSLSLRDKREIYLGVARFVPKNPTIDNFINVFTNALFPTYLWNGLKLAVFSGIGVLIVALPAAYAFSRFNFKGKGLWMMALLAFQMISPLVILVPLYRYMSRLGLVNTDFGAIMVYIAIGVPLASWLLKGTIDGIPRSLDEAAMIDGCSRWGIFWRIVLPLSTPGVASVFIITVIAGWSQFLVPFLLLTNTNLMPIGVGIFNFEGTMTATSTQVLAAACLISVVPAIVVFLALQRMILSAMTAGAVKG